MSARQFEEWRAYADIEPFDEERADLRAGQIIACLLNLEMARRGRQPTVKPHEVILKWGSEPEADNAPTAARRTQGALSTLKEIARANKAQKAREKQREENRKRGRSWLEHRRTP